MNLKVKSRIVNSFYLPDGQPVKIVEKNKQWGNKYNIQEIETENDQIVQKK